MTCERVPMPTGGFAIVCSSHRRQRCCCGNAAPLLCDWKVAGKRSGTCDAPICRSCSTSPTAGKDLCPKHAAEYEVWKAERAREQRG
jgi:hypothetical protein